MKERIIGAIVLVIIVVLVVPVFLDGPPETGEIVSERVLLPGQEGQDTKTVVLDRERSEPMPVANSSPDKPNTRDAVAAEPEEADTGATACRSEAGCAHSGAVPAEAGG